MKIAVYTITKNEEQFIQRWADSCKDADYRLIVDTGSEDNTIKEAKKNGCLVASISVKPWRFDDARNTALALVPDDVDYCIALDADEVLVDGWRDHFNGLDPTITRPRYKYVWSWNPDGSEGLVYSGDKIHARHGYRWKHPVHEVIKPVSQEKQGWIGLEIHHHPDSTKSRSQYLPLLELAVKEDPNDDRNRFYLGREYMFNNIKDKATEHLLEHLELSTWKPERATAMRYLSRVTNERYFWLLRACAEAPDRREPWVELASFYYQNKKWLECLAAAKSALEIKEKPLEYLCEAESWGALPHDLASIASWYIGLRDQALSHSLDAMAIDPYDIRLKNNHALMLSLMGKTSIDVVIPTKSNIEGLNKIIDVLLASEKIQNIIIVADGDHSLSKLENFSNSTKIQIISVPENSGIHVMWNKGMVHGNTRNHIAFLNDDVTINNETLDLLGSQLDRDNSIGLICPNYDGRLINGMYQKVNTTCRGRYDGTGGLAGFCMMLRSDLRSNWRFDERMKWWYGDDDIVNWIINVCNKFVAISSLATCDNNSSWTINNDPPSNFAAAVKKDAIIYNKKWGLDAPRSN
jgi:glycosyltransferase involved in cell wall biosynthesis